MSAIAVTGLQAGLVILVTLIFPCAYRVWKGPSAIERLQGADAITTLLMANIVVLALLQGVNMFIDVALALAAFSFVGTIAIARYISEGKDF